MNIGVISYFRERGLYYLSELFLGALEKTGSVHILAKPEGSVLRPIVPKDFQKVKRNVRFLEGSDVLGGVLRWTEDNALDVIFSFETYGHLPLNFGVLAEVKRRTSAKLIEIPLADCFWKQWVLNRDYSIFDAIVCLTDFCYKIFTEHGYKNAWYVKPGFVCSSGGVRKDGTIVYFHPGGWGGSRKRKNSINVLHAFDIASRERGDIELIFHSQMIEQQFRSFYSQGELVTFDRIRRNPKVTVYFGTLSRDVFLDLYSRSDAVVYPTLREGLGLTIFEAMSRGRPCITTDAPPANEVIAHGANGWLCKLERIDPAPESFTPVYRPALWDLIRILKALTKKQLLGMEPIVHKTISGQFSWEAFEKNVASLLEAIA